MRPPANRVLGADERTIGFRWLPPVTVMLGSLLATWPFVASFPVLPPIGLMMLLGWRLRRAEVFAIWAPLPLGLFDDLLSGQPLGSAMLLWTLMFFAIDIFSRRMMFRDYRQDWLIAGGAIGGCLIAGRIVAVRIDAHVDTALLGQAAASILLFPVVIALVERLDVRTQA